MTWLTWTLRALRFKCVAAVVRKRPGRHSSHSPAKAGTTQATAGLELRQSSSVRVPVGLSYRAHFNFRVHVIASRFPSPWRLSSSSRDSSPSSRSPQWRSRRASTRSPPAAPPSITTLATLAEPKRSAISDAGTHTTRACGALKPAGACWVVEDQSAGSHAGRELVQREFVHRNQHFGLRDQRRADALVRQRNVAVRAAAAHLRAVRRQPAYFHVLAHAHLRQQLPQQQDALPAKAGNLDGQVAGVMVAWGSATSARSRPAPALRRRSSPGSSGRRQLRLAVAEHAKRELRHHLFADPLARHHRDPSS